MNYGPGLPPTPPPYVTVIGSSSNTGAAQGPQTSTPDKAEGPLLVTRDMLDTVKIVPMSCFFVLMVLVLITTLLFIFSTKLALIGAGVSLLYSVFTLWITVHTWNRFMAKLLVLN